MQTKDDALVTLGGLATCDACRRARRWLADRGVDARFRDFRDNPPSRAEVGRWADRVGWETLLNRRSTTWRSLPPAQREALDRDRAVALMAGHPTLVKRPVLEAPGEVRVGFDPEAWARLVSP